MNMFSRKYLFWVNLCGVGIFVAALFSQRIFLCAPGYTKCSVFFDSVATIFVPIIPLFLFSLVAFWMRDIVYQTWFRFARVWVPVSMLAIFMAPEYASDWMYPIEKGTVALFMCALFVIISLIIIVRAWWRGRAV